MHHGYIRLWSARHVFTVCLAEYAVVLVILLEHQQMIAAVCVR